MLGTQIQSKYKVATIPQHKFELEPAELSKRKEVVRS
jgi:hypothetical protein